MFVKNIFVRERLHREETLVSSACGDEGGKFAFTMRKQESSAKLTNQRVSYAFTFSPFSIHVHHILSASKFQHRYSCILAYLFFTDH